MPKIHFLIHIILIFSAFFLGILFKEREWSANTSQRIPLFVNIEVKKNSISVIKNSPDIQLLVNGKEETRESFEVPK
jgi:hypothetical protein